MDLDVGVISEVEKKQKKKLLLDYLYDNLKNHNWWAYRYFFCELLAFLNIIGKQRVCVAKEGHVIFRIKSIVRQKIIRDIYLYYICIVEVVSVLFT